MSKKGIKPKAKKTTNKAVKTTNQSKTLKNLLVTLCVFAILAVPVYAFMQKSKIEHDLSVVGNGTPTVVQVHDQGCRLCQRLKSNLGDVKGDFKDKIQFKTADINKKSGRDFARKYNVPHVTLLFFNKEGTRVNSTQGVISSAEIKTNLENLVSRR